MALWLAFARGPFAAPPPAQHSFASPEEAARALAEATRSHNTAELQAIFGPDGEKLISSGDRYADEELQRRFAALYDEKHELMHQGPEHVQLEVGPDDWPLPIPIVQSGGRWHFDTQAGAQEIINRRIGRNELAAIRVSLAYVDAQKDYFARMRQETGTGVYAERLVSTRGQRDGLYWPARTGGPESPLGPLVEAAEEQGYPGEIVGGKPDPYQGYNFRILEAQGPNAPDGPRDYVRSGRMTGGFALVAWPASYGSSGIMSFEVNQDGLVFQKDLGPDTAQAAARITLFDPDLTWTRVDVTNN
ncbi:MAG: DUF2950 domain-containing protein [Acetobacteraceae bacterium]|nr:DUF2950 domain-containing protein [Acetobacteraceae bacterium]